MDELSRNEQDIIAAQPLGDSLEGFQTAFDAKRAEGKNVPLSDTVDELTSQPSSKNQVGCSLVGGYH
jgi:hypothetical protein